MANYHYDEGGNMAGYFVITFLAVILIPLTLSISPTSKKRITQGCQCQPCLDQRARVTKREKASILNPKLGVKGVILTVGWTAFIYLCYKVGGAKLDNAIYDPFEILGLRSGVTEKEIKSHFKRLSRMYHPDKVKVSVNETIEMIQSRFVNITKAYKSLTDETIRKNWELYGHPDGRQEMSTGIALPKWIIEGKNNIWVLGAYSLLIGGALPALVGKWWFGSRQRTKDGINARSAAAFFKSLKEESSMDEVVVTFSKAYQWETPNTTKSTKSNTEIDKLEREIGQRAGAKWTEVRNLVESEVGTQERSRRALVLLFAYLLRVPLSDSKLQKEQTQVLLQTPLLLNALLTISISRNWLTPTLSIMRLHAYLAQAILPGNDKVRWAQLPGINADEAAKLASGAGSLEDLVHALEEKGDGRVEEVRKAAQKWGKVEIVDASFKVIGERLVTPSSIVFLVVKLRLSPPTSSKPEPIELDADQTKKRIKLNDEKDHQFLINKKDTEDLPPQNDATFWAHAPHWPSHRKPFWWLVLADDKSNRVVVPPMKISDIPFSHPDQDRDYRSYKLQFQAPPNTGLFTWKVYLVSDTFIGEEVSKDIMLKIDDVSALNADEQASEDEISEPDEDTLAGQMAIMKGGGVKKRIEHDDDSDESSTDDDKSSGSSSDSDSD